MIKFIFFVFFIIGNFNLSAHAADNQGKKTLTIYTYSSFTSEWGAGPKISREFEKICNCVVKFFGFDDGVSLLSRLKFENQNTKADIILGLDNHLIAEARKTGLFAAHNLAQAKINHLNLPIKWQDDIFLPYDYGWFAFIYDKRRVKNPPSSMAGLIKSDYKILLQDPRTSTVGLGGLLWVRTVYGDDDVKIWKKLNKNIVAYTKGWSEAYGLFLKGEADLVLSYTSSPAYHTIAEQDDAYHAAIFDEGHMMQIEVAGKIKSSKNQKLNDLFLNFMIGKNFQKHIPETNWMYPVNKNIALDKRFENLPKPKKSLLLSDSEFKKKRKKFTERWLSVQ